MAYSTASQVRVRLKDDVKQEYSEELLNLSISNADSFIDAYLCNFYDTTAFTSSDPIINTLSIFLASAFVTGSAFNDFDQASSTWESKMYNWAKNTLKLIQDGTVQIPGKTRIGV